MRSPPKRRLIRRRRRNRKVRSLRSRLPSPREVGERAVALAKRGIPIWIALGAVAVVSTALWLGYAWLTSSERFEVRALQVRGAEHLADDAVRTIAAVPPSANVFRVDLTAIEHRLEAHPWIQSAAVDRRLPDQLVIDVVEREPAALVELDGLYLAEANGHVFKRAAIDRGEGDGLPVITGLTREDYLAEPATAEAAIRAGLGALATYTRGGQRPAIGEIHIDPRRGITLVTFDTALALRLGRGYESHMPEKLAAFDTAWQALNEDERAAARVIYMDNQANSDRITVRFEGAH